MKNKSKAIILDMDETLEHGIFQGIYDVGDKYTMILRPNLDLLISKLKEVKKQGVDIILCTTAREEWVQRFFKLKPEFKNLFDKIYTRNNENEWRDFSKEKYQLEYGNAFVYIDANGNMLEISSENANLPIIRGYSTAQDSIKAGNKLNDEDCNKLLTVEKFLKAAQTNGIYDIITYMDISNDKDYTIEMPSKGKTAYLGDDTSINDKMLILKEILNREEGKNGEVFLNDLNKIFFREKV